MASQVLSTGWSWELGPLVGILLLGCWYFAGAMRVWSRAGVGHGIRPGQVAAFIGGLLTLVVALLSPVDTLVDELFSMHMLQHMLLILVAAPLLALSGLPIAGLSVLPRRWVTPLGRTLGPKSRLGRTFRQVVQPAAAWVIFTAALWIWHIPGLYEAALQNELLHTLEHVCLLLAGILFWWVLFQPANDRATRLGISILYLFTNGLQMSLFGALFTFAGHPLYPAYAAVQIRSGIDPVQDQQLAGLIMWIPGGVLFTLLSAGFFVAWFQALEERAARMDIFHRWDSQTDQGNEGKIIANSLPKEDRS